MFFSLPVRRIAAAFAAFGPLLFLTCEAISAVAWTAGTYDYGVNFISDLGTTVCGSYFSGRVMCSPSHGVMNFGFAAMGISVAIATISLAAALPRGRRETVSVMGVLLAIGMILVAVFPGGIESMPDGTIVFHVLGAAGAILFGNVIGVIAGVNRRRLGFPAWFGPVGIGLGIVGTLSLVGCLVYSSAVFERMAVYSIFAWLLAASALLVRPERNYVPISVERRA